MTRWLAVLALAASCGKKAPHVELVFELEPTCAAHAPADALERTLPSIRERIVEIGSDDAVSTRDGKLIVELAGKPDAVLVHDTRALVLRYAALDMKLIDESSDFMLQLCERAMRDPQAAQLGISVGRDRACYLQAADRDADRKLVSGKDVIRDYIAQLAKTDPYYVLPPDAPLAFGETGAREARAWRTWRTWWLHPEVVLATTTILGARGSLDPHGGSPIVEMKLSLYGERAFAALANHHGGSRLAMLLEGKVKYTVTLDPSARHGDTVVLPLAGDTMLDREEARDDLVAVLRVGSLPCPLRTVSSSD